MTVPDTIETAERRPRRSLILAGGGMKVAFQAGVLQVWLEEADLPFDHVDGCSGGTFNLAMLCQGHTGTEVADAWRRTSPARGTSLAWSQLWRLPYATSLMTLEAYRRRVYPTWASTSTGSGPATSTRRSTATTSLASVSRSSSPPG